MPAVNPNPINLSGSGSQAADSPSYIPPLRAISGVTAQGFIAEGILFEPSPSGLLRVAKYMGAKTVPGDIARLRRSVYELMRRMGTPVIVKHLITDSDVKANLAKPSPNFDAVYGQVRNNDPLSHGVGFVSLEVSDDEWVNPVSGEIVRSTDAPAPGYTPAPRFRGYGPGYLTYMVEPDAAEDFYRHTPEGVFIRVQRATAQAAWFPDINDNDLIISATLDDRGNVIATNERYEARMTNPISLRGSDRRGRREYSGDAGGNRWVINQQFEMDLLPSNHQAYKVETDR